MKRRTDVLSKEMRAVLRSVFLIAPLLWNSPLFNPKHLDSSVFIVTNAEDGEPDSLRMLIKNVPSGSTITFSPSLPKTIYITDYIMINKDLVIEGPGADKLAISTNGLDSLFAVGSSVNISGLTLAEGTTQTGISGTYGGSIWNSGALHLENVVFQNNAAQELGGAIYNRNDGKLYIESCTFFHNRTLDFTSAGGALANEGNAVITNTTFYANYAGQYGGAIYNISGNLEIINSTIWGNTVGLAGGGGITIKGGRVRLKRITIVAGNHNQAGDMQDDVVGSFASEGYNLVQFRGTSQGYIASDFPDRIDPLLSTSDPLYTASESDSFIGIQMVPKVIPLKSDSPAIDAIPLRFCDTKIDQLNTPRPQERAAIQVLTSLFLWHSNGSTMNINELTLSTPDLATQRDFYQNVLKLPVTMTDAKLIVQVGMTKLTFVQAEVAGVYHFAFNIPENQLAAAREWLTVPLIKANDGRDEFFIESWSAHTIYFYDSAGNILELIARHTLDNASSEPFSETSLLNISEIGVAVENVPAFIENSGLPAYGTPGDMFAPLGDEDGLLIVVKIGRQWFPDTQQPALELPLHVVITSQGMTGEISGTPHARFMLTSVSPMSTVTGR